MASKINDSKKYLCVMLICLAIMVGFGYIPPIGDTITPQGMRMLGIFIGMIFGWLYGYNASTSVMALVVTGLLYPGLTVDAVITSAFGTMMLWMIFFAMIFAYGLNKCGILDYVSAKIMSLKIVSKSPWHLAMGIWFCTIVCMAICGVPVAIMIVMFSLFYNIAEKIGAGRRSNYVAYVLVFIAGFCAISVGLVPYSGNLLVAIGFMLSVDSTISYSLPVICVINWVLILGMWVIAGIISKFAFKSFAKPDFTLTGESLYTEKVPATKAIKVGFLFIAILLVIMVLPSFLPAGNALKVFLGKFGMAGVFALVVLIMTVVPIDGKRMLDIEEALKNGAVSWGIFFIMPTAFALGAILVGQDTGIATLLSNVIGNLTGGMSIYLLVCVLLIILLALTNCITNIVAAQLVVPVITIALLAKGINPGLVIGMAGVIFDYGLVLPSGSPLGAYIHANSEWMTSAQCYKYGLISVLCLTISICAIGVPLALFLM